MEGGLLIFGLNMRQTEPMLKVHQAAFAGANPKNKIICGVPKGAGCRAAAGHEVV
jgi:hypothetical protein